MKLHSGLYEVLTDLASRGDITLSNNIRNEALSAFQADLIRVDNEIAKLAKLQDRLTYFRDRLTSL